MPVPGEGGRASLSFAFVGAAGAGELPSRLGLHDPRSDGEVLQACLALTAREAEVLPWLAGGKSNRDVAAILELAPRPVNEHLETVFANLGVENRVSAAVLAVRALGKR